MADPNVCECSAVTLTSPSDPSRAAKHGNQPNNRRNLYVLGLPFDLTK